MIRDSDIELNVISNYENDFDHYDSNFVDTHVLT